MFLTEEVTEAKVGKRELISPLTATEGYQSSQEAEQKREAGEPGGPGEEGLECEAEGSLSRLNENCSGGISQEGGRVT